MNLLSVMVVDDSEADQFISKLTIEEYDPSIEVLQAFDGQEALDILDTLELQPSVIFLDINMPRMNGHEFLEVYEQRSGAESSVIIMLTSSEQKEDIERSSAYKSVKNYFTKPLDIDDLDTVLK